MFLEHKVMVFQMYRIGYVWKNPFRKSGHILYYTHAYNYTIIIIIGLFKRLDSSTCVVIINGNAYTISFENVLRFNLVSFKFQKFPLSTLLF